MAEFESVIVNKIRFAASKIIPRRELVDLIGQGKLEMFADAIADGIVAQFEVKLLGNTFEEHEIMLLPKTWFDHLKGTLSRFKLFGWLKARYERVPLTRITYNLCPHLSSRSGDHVEFMVRK